MTPVLNPTLTSQALDVDAYAGDAAAFKIEDDETSWYVADSAHEALKEHITFMDADDAEEEVYIVRRLPPTETIALVLEDEDDLDPYRDELGAVIPGFTLSDVANGERPKVEATAATWADFISRQLGYQTTYLNKAEQICSSRWA